MLGTPLSLLSLIAGLALATLQIDSLDTPSETRSGLVVILGTGFGPAQGTSSVLVDGLPAITTTDTEIHRGNNLRGGPYFYLNLRCGLSRTLIAPKKAGIPC